MTYAEIVERVLVEAQVVRPSLDWDRLRVALDAAFFQLNSNTAQAYAANSAKREMLRTAYTITFTDGVGELPAAVLKAYIEDGTFTSGTNKYSYLPYPSFLRAFDRRLGYWTNVGETLEARLPTTGAAQTGDVVVTFISSPPIPATADDEFEAPEDYLPDLFGALIQFIVGQTSYVAVKSA